MHLEYITTHFHCCRCCKIVEDKALSSFHALFYICVAELDPRLVAFSWQS
jgi:hypothetical protein